MVSPRSREGHGAPADGLKFADSNNIFVYPYTVEDRGAGGGSDCGGDSGAMGR